MDGTLCVKVFQTALAGQPQLLPEFVKLLLPPQAGRGISLGLLAWHIILIVAQPGRKRDPDASAGEPPTFGKIVEDHFSRVFV